MTRTLTVAAVLVILLVGLALSGAVDLGGGKRLLSGIATHLLGRELRIDGELRLRLGPTPRIAAAGIVLGNPDRAPGYLLRIRQLELELDLFSLWHGPVQVNRLLVDGATVDLVTLEDGRNNWTFGAPSGGEAKAAAIRWPVVIHDGIVSDSRLRLSHPELHTPAEIWLDRVETGPEGAENLQLSLQGRVNDLPLRARGRAGTYAALVAGENIELAAELELGKYRLRLQGSLGNLARLEGFDVDAHLTGPDAAALYEALHFSQPDSGPVDLKASIGDLPAGMRWSVIGQFGSLQADMAGELRDPLALDGLHSRIAVAGGNLDRAAGWLGIRNLPPEPFRLEGAVSREGSHLEVQGGRLQVGRARLQAEAIIPHFPDTRDGNVTARLAGPGIAQFRDFLGLQGVTDAPFSVDAAIQGRSGGPAILDSTLQVGDLNIALHGPVGPYPGLVGSAVNFELTGESLRNLLAEAGVRDGPEVALSASGLLRIGAAYRLELADGRFELADLSIDMSGEIQYLDNPVIRDLRLQAKTPSLADSLQQLGFAGLPDAPATLRANLSGPAAAPVIEDVDARLGDATLQLAGKISGFPTLDGSRATVDIEIPTTTDWLPIPVRHAVSISAQLRGDGQQLWLKQLKGTSDQWQLRGEVHVSDLERRLGSLQLSAKGSGLAAVLPPFKGFQAAADPFTLEADIVRETGNLAFRTLRLQLADNHLAVSGTLSDEADAALTVDLGGGSLASIGEFEQAVLPDAPYALTGKLRRAGALWSADELDVTLGKQELSGSLQLKQGQRPRYVARLHSDHFNLGQFVRKRDDPPPKEPTEPTARGPLLIPDDALPLDWMDRFDAELDLDLAGLAITDPAFPEYVALDALQVEATLEAGMFTASQLRLAGDRGTLAVPMILHWRGGELAMDLAIHSEQFRVSLLTTGYTAEGVPQQRIRSRLRGRGGSAHQLASTLTGFLLLESGKGRLEHDKMGRMFDSFTNQLITTVNPFFKEDPYTELDCGVVGIEFRQGTALLDPGAIFRTSKMDIMATGEIDLGTETLRVAVNTKPRKGLGISAASLVTPFVQVQGTLASPGIGIDKSSAAVTGGAAAATAGLSILATSLWNRYMNKADPCLLAAQNAQQRLDEVNAEARTAEALGEG